LDERPLDLSMRCHRAFNKYHQTCGYGNLREKLPIAWSGSILINSILRQKTYHDHKMPWHQLKLIDFDYVDLPQKNAGWEPFKISQKLS